MNAYRRELEELAQGASGYVGDYIDAFRATSPDASVATMRDAAIAAIDDTLNAFGRQAAEVAGALFDEVAKAEGIDARFVPEDVIDPSMLDEGVRYRARELVSGNDSTFKRDVADLTRFYVKRTAFENMARNCDRNGVRYARVPSGMETCAFCFMLSSRGFVYHSELTAKGRGLHGMHQHCDCIIVPGVKGETNIEGYDPDAMYDRWCKCAETVGADARDFSYKNRQKIMDEVAQRDWKWLNSPAPGFKSRLGKEPGARPLEKEWRVGEALAGNGFAVRFIKESKAHKDPDAYLNGRAWEFKVPEAYNEKTVKNQFKKAVGKGTDALVITNVMNHAPRESMLSDIKEITAGGEFREIREVLFVDEAGNVSRVKR